MNTEKLDSSVTEQPELVQENGKRKRVMTDKQLKALEEGRKKRWMSKPQVKEEKHTSASEEEDKSTENHTSESDDSRQRQNHLLQKQNPPLSMRVETHPLPPTHPISLPKQNPQRRKKKHTVMIQNHPHVHLQC